VRSPEHVAASMNLHMMRVHVNQTVNDNVDSNVTARQFVHASGQWCQPTIVTRCDYYDQLGRST
jgi:hypothetical protein